jgi:hypothetical protein
MEQEDQVREYHRHIGLIRSQLDYLDKGPVISSNLKGLSTTISNLIDEGELSQALETIPVSQVRNVNSARKYLQDIMKFIPAYLLSERKRLGICNGERKMTTRHLNLLKSYKAYKKSNYPQTSEQQN